MAPSEWAFHALFGMKMDGRNEAMSRVNRGRRDVDSKNLSNSYWSLFFGGVMTRCFDGSYLNFWEIDGVLNPPILPLFLCKWGESLATTGQPDVCRNEAMGRVSRTEGTWTRRICQIEACSFEGLRHDGRTFRTFRWVLPQFLGDRRGTKPSYFTVVPVQVGRIPCNDRATRWRGYAWDIEHPNVWSWKSMPIFDSVRKLASQLDAIVLDISKPRFDATDVRRPFDESTCLFRVRSDIGWDLLNGGCCATRNGTPWMKDLLN